MTELHSNKRYIYARWFLLRLGLVLYDIFAVNAAYYLALVVRFYVNYEFNVWAVKYVPAFFRFAPGYTMCCLVVFAMLGLYNSLWKYAGMSDLHRIVQTSLITCAIQVIGMLLFVMRIYYHKHMSFDVLYMFREIFRGILPGCVAACVICWPLRSLAGTGLSAFLLKCVIFMAVYGGALWTIGLNQAEKTHLKEMFRK